MNVGYARVEEFIHAFSSTKDKLVILVVHIITREGACR